MTPSNSPSRNDGEILINSAHTVQVTSNVIVDQVIVEGAVIVSSGSIWNISNDASGTDLIIKGKVQNLGTIRGHSSSISQAEVDNGGILINESSGVVITGNLILTFLDGSTYEHNRDGGTIPSATWNPTSTCLIDGIITDNPANTAQTFGNFEWNCPNMLLSISIGTIQGVQGDFTVVSTGLVGALQYTGSTLSVDQNFYLNSGGFQLTGASGQKLSIAGDFDMSLGTFVLATGTSSNTMNVGGDFTLTAGIISQLSSVASTISFNGVYNPDDPATKQAFTILGLFSGQINFETVAGSALNFGNLATGGTVDLSGSTGTFTNHGSLFGSFFPVEFLSDVINIGIILPTGGPLVSDGIMEPGNSVGTFVVNGDLTITGTLSMEIEGSHYTEHDRIIVTGEVDISGATLEADFGTYVPADMETYQLVAASTYAGGSPAYFAGVSGSGTGFTLDVLDEGDGKIKVTNIVLPIDLISFSGERTGQNVTLNWRTTQEINNDYIAVERAGHNLQFEEIGRVSGAGTTTEIQDYRFVDRTPISGVNYYRLRQVDTDGKVEYHEVIYVDFADASVSHALKVFPNPAPESIRASWARGTKENATLRIINSSGQLLRSYAIYGDQATFELPLEGLTSGVYILQLERQGGLENVRFIKQ